MMKRFFAMILSGMLVLFCLAGCGGAAKYADSPYLGDWSAVSAEYLGMEFAVADILGSDWVFTLNENGSCDMTLLDEDESGDWDETETGFSIEDEFMFTVENGVAILDYDGVTLTFEQQ